MKQYWFTKQWKDEMIKKILMVDPTKDKDEISKYLDNVLEDKFKDHKCVVRNTYKGQNANTSLMNLCQFIHDHKPIMAGYGCLYKNQDDVYNPAAHMLLESIETRKELKSARKKYDKRSYDFLMLDIGQGNEKVIANSFYGANGTKTSTFFNRDIASSITASGQAEIAVAQTSFEMFLANNVKFFDMDECLLFISRIIHDCKYDMEVPEMKEPPYGALYNRLASMFMYSNKIDHMLLQTVIGNLTEEECAKVYYKNNLMGFMKDHKETHDLMHKLINKTKSFKDPNSIPDELVDDLEQLWCYVREFVVYDFPVRNRIERDKYISRRACIVQDTDSTMLTLSNLMNFMVDEFAEDEVAAENEEEFDYILVNISCYLLTLYSNTFFDRSCTDVNIPERYHWMIYMKNEFYYPILVTTKAKKHYITLTKLQEGKEINPPKIELHGLEISKSETSEYTYNFFFNIIKNDIMYTDKINVATILNKIRKFKEEIHDSLAVGEMKFLPLKSVKEIEAYETPFSEQGIRAVRTWNLMYPDMEINLPDKVLALNIKCGKHKDFEAMRGIIPHDRYDKIEEEIFNSTEKSIANQGFNIIAIPQNLERIPEWLIPLIDYTKIADDNASKFNTILESLGVVLLDTKSSGTSHASNIIHF